MNPLFKWPGGKSSELYYIKSQTPDYDRYIEPFLGGGAAFFGLQPQKAIVNDINPTLIDAYKFIKEQPEGLKALLNSYEKARRHMEEFATKTTLAINQIHKNQTEQDKMLVTLDQQVDEFYSLFLKLGSLDFDQKELYKFIKASILDKAKRIFKSQAKSVVWTDEDKQAQFLTSIHAGFYSYIRSLSFSDKLQSSARFLYLREFCYGGMFRFNKSGGFNIPYGGRSYNNKSFSKKIDYWFSPEVLELLQTTEIYNLSFEKLFAQIKLSQNDFLFLDPPYDSQFSDYDGLSFDREKQTQLAEWVGKASCQTLVIIGKTDFVQNLYEQQAKKNSAISIEEYEKTYAYNIKGRNQREIVHLAIKNY